MSTFQIEFEPNYRTLTEVARSHFKRPVDAIAEYVDNSIQACGVSSEANIRVCLFLAAFSFGFFLILDNGTGMNVSAIKDFATYSLDQQERNPDLVVGGNRTFIGKFGVGAKQAGFYLGDRIKLFTKPPEYHGTNLVLSFCLDSKELKRRHQAQQSVYSGVVRELDLDGSLDLDSNENTFRLIESTIKDHFRKVPHGSAFLVNLRERPIVPQLRAIGDDTLQRQLNDIYHFHLHPADFHDNLLSQRASSSSSQPVRTEVPLKITYERYTMSPQIICELSSKDDFFQQCKENAVADIFKFKMEAPLPGADQDTTKKYNIHGFFLYFPFKDGEETIPTMENNNRTIRIYWQNRQVPDENELKELFFLPAIHSRKECFRSKIARNWRDRIVGFLFFDWEFDQIANNKLRFLVKLHDWFNITVNTNQILTHPHTIKSQFEKWLVKCHKEDREFLFKDRDHDKDTADCYFFKSVIFEQTNLRVNVGDRIKIKPTTRNCPDIYGEVVSFFVDKDLCPDDENSFLGNGGVCYKRLPRELFGSKEEEESVSCIDSLMKADELAGLLSEIPSSVDLFLFEKASDKGTLIDADTELKRGFKYHKIGIQIKNAHNEIVCHLPDRGRSTQLRYEISMQSSEGKDYGRVSDLFKYDEAEKKDKHHNPTSKRDKKDCFYSVRGITMPNQGLKSFHVAVYSPHSKQPIFKQKIPCIVVTMPAMKFDIEETEFFVQLGQPIRAFSVRFLDCVGCNVPFEGEVKLEINSKLEQIQVLSNGSKELIRKIKPDDDGLLCKQGDWVVTLKPETTLFGTEVVEMKKDVEFSLSLFIRNAQTNEFEQFSSPFEFKATCSPGQPAQFAVLKPNTQPITVESGGTLDVLHIAMLDQWGHRVSPRAANQQLLLKLGKGPLVLPNNVAFSGSGELLLLNVSCKEVNQSQTFWQSLDLVRISGGKSTSVEDFQHTTLEIVVSASNLPNSIKIQRAGEDLSEFLTCTAGETLSELTFIVLNESGEEIDEILLPLKKNSWMECDWIPKSRGKKKRDNITSASDFSLPDIDIPENVSASPFEATLTVVLNGWEHSVTLSITIKPAEPAKWSLVHSPYLETQGVVVLDSDDLQKNIRGAVCTDKFGNFVPIDTIASSGSSSSVPFSPSLKVFIYNDDQMELEAEDSVTFQRIRLQPGEVMIGEESSTTKKRKRNEVDAPVSMKGFVLPPSKFLNQPPDGKKIAVCIADNTNQLNPSKSLSCPVVTSLPQRVLLSFGNATQPASEMSIAVSNFSTISDLYTHICDSHDNEASLRGIEATKIEVLDSKGRKVFSVNDIEASIVPTPLNYDFLAVQNDDEEGSVENPSMGDRVVKFECKLSYKRGGQTITLPSAFLRCIVKKLDNVVDLKMETLAGTDTLHRAHNSNIYSLNIPCGTAPPSFALMLVTDNGRPLSPEVNSFCFRAKKTVGKAKPTTSFNELFKCETDNSQHRLILSPTEQLANQQEPCIFDFEIVYEEKRGAFATLSEEKKSNKIKLVVHFVPGSLAKLKLDDHSMMKIHNKSFSNSKDPRQSQNTGNIRLHGSDEFGNIVAFSPSQKVRCRIVASEGESLTSFNTNPTVPRLLGADMNGFVASVMEQNKRECKFSRIQLDSNDRSTQQWRDGSYFLRFSLCESTSSDVGEELLSIHVPFQFTSDETKMLTRLGIERLLDPLVLKVQEYNEWEKRCGQLNFQLRNLQDQCPPEIRNVGLDAGRLNQLYDQRTTQNGTRVSSFRPPERNHHIDPVNFAGEAEKVIGQVVDLGFVDDLDEAKLLSWASGKGIGAMIVKDSDTAMRLYHKRIMVFALDQISPFQASGRATRQNPNRETRSGQLDLPPIVVHDIQIPPERQPRYLVNMIRLNPEHEHLRGTVFFAIFSNSILFHTMEDAVLYRKKLRSQGIFPPKLFTMRGEKIEKNGMLDPDPSARMPSRLDFVYGEQKKEFSDDHELNLIKKLIEMIQELKTLEDKMKEVNINDINREIAVHRERLRST